MTVMVECVAQAIFESSGSMHAPASWDECNEGQRENVRRQARAAIEAMRSGGFICETEGSRGLGQEVKET